MEQARSAVSKIFSGEPRSYTRFNLTQNMEGENSQVEMKLSSDMDEEMGGNGVGEHLNHISKPYVSKPVQRTPRNVCLVVITALLVFIIGYLIGYASHRKTDTVPLSCSASTLSESDGFNQGLIVPEPVAQLDWESLRALLRQKLTISGIEDSFRDFSDNSHQAGSPGDENLANKVFMKFKAYEMNPWVDEHFVKVQDPPETEFNKVTYNGQAIGSTRGYLAYSATGEAKGPVVYGHYGLMDDIKILQYQKIVLNGKILLFRAGKISFAEKVANAASVNASAVLIYPDPLDYPLKPDTDLYGHVHLGTGDPYTPGFPSFNHTQFPPAQSSGLPSIPAQTITANMATAIMKRMGGLDCPSGWRDGELHGVQYKLGDDADNVTVVVKNVLKEKKIHNVFGVIKGFIDPDRYVVIGAQRDAWGPGFAKSTVGTSLLVEVARAITAMIQNDGFTPRRSIVFASWSAGEFGSVGATEWLEGYLSSLNMKAFSYISLDGVVTGPTFKASASPLVYDLIQSTLKEVSSFSDSQKSVYDQVTRDDWEKAVMEPMELVNPAYPFLAFSGIPSISFRFVERSGMYPYFGTILDTREMLDIATSYNTPQVAKTAAEIAGQMALRLVHDRLLKLNVERYRSVIRSHVVSINWKMNTLQKSGILGKNLTVKWLISALGSYNRASSELVQDIQNSDLDDVEQCRIINDRIMGVERDFLSPYVSIRESPFRHILMGSGSHTLGALLEHLVTFNAESDTVDKLRDQFALATWTIQGCANGLAGDIWAIDKAM